MPLTLKQVQALTADMPPRCRAMVVVRAGLGLRIGELLGAAVKKAGLPAGTTRHDLRHHYASVLLAAGDSVVAVAERLGHEDATLVMTTGTCCRLGPQR